ncbi:MAG: efflux RND transporter permease subunit [Candidatus Coatesbacteria bacterium]|nr:efflux RND transporter permease subunit [Candidatus Coatesbacteria bacterium]
MILSKISIRRPVLATMVIMSLVVFGIFTYIKLPIDLMPPVDFPVVTIQTIYPGAGPQDIETSVTKPIEDAVSSIAGVKYVESISGDSYSVVIIRFEVGIDVDQAALDVKDKVDPLKSTLPEDAKAPAVMKIQFGAGKVVELVVATNMEANEARVFAEDKIANRLTQIQGVGQVSSFGTRVKRIEILVDKKTLDYYDLSIMQIAALVGSQSLKIPGGYITEEKNEYTIRVDGEFKSVDEIRELKLSTQNGILSLYQIAKVEDTLEEIRKQAKYQGKNIIGLSVEKRSDGNSVQVGNDTKKVIEEMKKEIPQGTSVDIIRDYSKFISDAIDEVISNLLTGIILTAILLYIFLHSWRGTLIAAISMPISVISTFTLLYFANFSINMMTLMALAINIGVLVTNSIVVLEVIQIHFDSGESSENAADKGTAEIAVAVIASTLTNVVVFFPIGLMSGIIGQIFRQFGLTVVFATFVSLIISFTLVPMLASIVYKKKKAFESPLKKFFDGFDKFYSRLERSYASSLSWVLHHKAISISSGFVALLLSFFLLKHIGSEFVPSTDEGYFNVNMELPLGANIDETSAITTKVENILLKKPEVESAYSVVGEMQQDEATNLANINVKLKPLKERNNLSTFKIMDKLREELAVIPGVKIYLLKTQSMGGGGHDKDLEIELTGDDINKLNNFAYELIKLAKKIPGIVDIDTNWRTGKPEILIVPDRKRCAYYGLSTAQVAQLVRTYINGYTIAKYRMGEKEYDIVVRLTFADRKSVEEVSKLRIPVEDGSISLSEVANISISEGPSQITRKDRQKLIKVSANLTGISMGDAMNEIGMEFPKLNLPAGYKIKFGGMGEIMKESFGDLYVSLFLAIILTYMTLAAILESFIQPLIIMFTFLFALIGIFLALFLTGQTINILSIMAMIMLLGIVVNNAILLLDYTNQLLREGECKTAYTALIKACPVRLRPIIMSNAATVVSMLPLALGYGAAGEFRMSMAIVSIGGLIISTIMTLYLIPAYYQLTHREIVCKTEK